MPCRPAEDDPSLNPGHGSIAARLLLWLCEALERDPPIWAYDIARHGYSLDERPTVQLCRLLRELPDATRQELLLRDRHEARELQYWWETHRQADAARTER